MDWPFVIFCGFGVLVILAQKPSVVFFCFGLLALSIYYQDFFRERIWPILLPWIEEFSVKPLPEPVEVQTDSAELSAGSTQTVVEAEETGTSTEKVETNETSTSPVPTPVAAEAEPSTAAKEPEKPKPEPATSEPHEPSLTDKQQEPKPASVSATAPRTTSQEEEEEETEAEPVAPKAVARIQAVIFEANEKLTPEVKEFDPAVTSAQANSVLAESKPAEPTPTQPAYPNPPTPKNSPQPAEETNISAPSAKAEAKHSIDPSEQLFLTFQVPSITKRFEVASVAEEPPASS